MIIPPNCLLKFTAEWCQPCKVIGAVIGPIAADAGLPVLSIDIAERPEMAQAYGIRSVPYVVGIRDDAPVGAVVGAQGEDAYRALVAKVIGG